jgi:hypothetical protein
MTIYTAWFRSECEFTAHQFEADNARHGVDESPGAFHE